RKTATLSPFCFFFFLLMFLRFLLLRVPQCFVFHVLSPHLKNSPSLFHPTPALKDDRFQMVLFTPQLVRITLTNVSVSDEGGYFCQLYTDSTHHQVATLSVSVPPETPTVEVKEEAVEGGDTKLTCVSPRSKPAATLRWMRNGREIPGTVSQQDNGKTFSVYNTITIPVERKDNGAALNCEAQHPALNGQKRVRHHRLDVYFAPTVRIVPPTGILREGDSLSLTCSITGNPLRTEKCITLTYVPIFLGEVNICVYVIYIYFLLCSLSDPGAVVETHSAVPYAVIGGVLALLVFTVICVLIVTIWCSVRQKGSYLTHEASGLDEHGEVQEAFLNGNDASQGKKEYLL
uniref:Cell adhesion molecule 4 n=1 Tax=Fundulus heteroclitus TaxID=8078 RepID=A0A3Q2UCN4_FUNHE